MTAIMRVEIASSVLVAAYSLSQNERYDIPGFYHRLFWNQEPNEALARLFLDDFSESRIGSWWITCEWRTLPLPADIRYDIRAALYLFE